MSTDTGSGMSTVFVIPHKGRPEMLVDTLHSIRKQEGFKGKICVVVVTKEPALRISQNWLSPEGNKVPVKIITVPDEYTISAQRNTGVKAIKSTHVAFIDADVDLSNNWLLCMQSLLNDSAERIMVSSVQICDDDAPMVERIRTSQANVSGDARPAHLPGANLFARRADVVRVGGFPEHLSTCEDYYFSVEMAKHGELYTTSQADFIHLGEDKNLWTLFVKEIWRGASNLDSIEGREIPRSEWPSFIVPAWSLFWTLIFWISLFNGWLSLFLLSAIAIIVPSVLYAFRLKKKTDCDVIFAFVVLHYMVYFVARGVGMLKSGSRIFAKFALRKIKAKLADRSGKKSNFSSSAAGTVALNSNPVADNAGKNAQQRTRAQSNASASASGGPTSGTAKATAPVGKRASNTQTGAPLRVMQFICSTGFYGAEGWILALANNTDRKDVEHHLAVSREPENKDLELTRRYRKLGLPAHEIPMSSRFDVSVIKKLIKLIKDNQIDSPIGSLNCIFGWGICRSNALMRLRLYRKVYCGIFGKWV